MTSTDTLTTPFAPLREPVFRMLWIAWLLANICMWMNDVAAAWMMATLTTKPLLVALVQTASTLPILLLGLPSGALADSLDRKRYFLTTQLWVAAVAVALSTVVLIDKATPNLLLLLVFANGIGMAMRWPVFAAIVPELVSRAQLPAALALNGLSMNASRIIGPLLAGMVIASAGSAWVFMLNALLSLCAALLIALWHRKETVQPLGRERLFPAMRVGWLYVTQSNHLKGVLLRIGIFFFYSTALMALLPLLVLSMKGGSAAGFTLLLASMGAGAVIATVFLPAMRRRYSRDGLLLRGGAVFSLSMLILAITNHLFSAVPAMLFAGAAWITTGNTLSLTIQLGLPDWVRARGMSIFQMTFMGASALGSAIWGQIATWTDVPLTLGIAATTGWLALVVGNKWMPDPGLEDDLTPKSITPVPTLDEPPQEGHVCVSIEYFVSPDRACEFRELMFNESRRSRLRHGALSWELLHDIHDPRRFIEVVVDASWTDHLRRFDRLTATDIHLRERKLAFHIGESPPQVSRCLMESTRRWHSK